MTQDNEYFDGIIARLRGENNRGLGRGFRRTASLWRGGVGLATGVFKGTRRGAEATLTDRDIKSLEAMVNRLGELKGLPMKFGQIMSYLELEMPEETRRLLSLLQRQSAATPWNLVEAVLLEDLGARADELIAGMERIPVSIASIGQVYRATIRGADRAERQVAVKVRHPGIEDAIRSDFRIAATGTGFAGMILPGMGATAKDFVAELQARLLEECDYRLEADHQRLFGGIFADHRDIVVPEVLSPWCGPRVLTSEWITGNDFETFRARASQAERNRVGAALFDFYIGTLYRHGLFHADPHPGNYEHLADGRLVVFDYGCVRIFEPEVAAALADLTEAVRMDDRQRVVRALNGLGAEPSSNDQAYAHLRQILRGFFGPMLTEGPHPIDGRIVVNFNQVARDKLAIARLRLPGRLVFLFRIRFGLYAILSRLGAVCDWSAMERQFAEESRDRRPSLEI